MRAAKVIALVILGFVLTIIFASGCSDATPQSAYSSGPESAGQGLNMKNPEKQPAVSYGSVAGGTGTGGATSTGSQD